MLLLIIAVLFGLLFALFATQNTSMTSVVISGYPVDMPVYIVVLGSLLIGIIVSWIISMMDSFGSMVNMWGKDAKITESKHAIRDLSQKVKELEQENTKLRSAAPSKLPKFLQKD